MTGSPAPGITGYVLAGGRSSRMGQDKALLDVDGAPLIEHALRNLRPVCSQIRILSGPPNLERDVVLACSSLLVPDFVTGQWTTHDGPLAGLSAALHDCTTPYALLLAVDQPRMPAAVLTQLALAGTATCAPAACLAVDGKPQPLPLLVSRDLRGSILHALRAGQRRLLETVQGACAEIDRQLLQLSPVSETAEIFANLNTPDDLHRWTAQTSSNQSLVAASEIWNG